MIPPKALIGSDKKAALSELIGLLCSETPHGLACFIITVAEMFLLTQNL